jgi:hypothetical protein
VSYPRPALRAFGRRGLVAANSDISRISFSSAVSRSIWIGWTRASRGPLGRIVFPVVVSSPRGAGNRSPKSLEAIQNDG